VPAASTLPLPHCSQYPEHTTSVGRARATLQAVRWPDGPICPHCGSAEKPYQLQGKAHRPDLWKCVDCRKQFTVPVGTPFERSKVPLSKWLMAAYLLCSSSKGISAQQLHRMLGVTYKTAWRMAHRIREAMLHQNPHLVPTALWLPWILLGEQKRRNQEKAVATQ
jgi:transposase-like protein